jgi:type II secretory pathway component PulC
MFNSEQLQYYLAQDRVAKAILALLSVFLLLSIIQLLKINFMPAHQQAAPEVMTRVHNQAFVANPLFGQSPTSGVLQQTRLNLTLKGTFAGTLPKTGAAIINNAKSGDKIYIVGDTVEGAIIEDIQPDYVVLEYQGNREMLRLPEGKRLTTP